MKKNNITRWSLRMLADLQLTSITAQLLVNDVALRLDRQNTACKQVYDGVAVLQEQQERSTARDTTTNNNNHNMARMQHADSSSASSSYSSSSPRVIRAVLPNFRIRNVKQVANNNHEIQQQQQQQHQIDTWYSQVLKNIQNLQLLHTDTYRLCHDDLMLQQQQRSSSRIFQRWSKSDQYLVQSIMEQIRARHANSIETWADVVLDLRAIHRCQYQQPNQYLTISDNTMSGENSDSSSMPSSSSSSSSFLWLNHRIDSILQGRWGIQLLCDHYVSLYKQLQSRNPAAAGSSSGGAIRKVSIPDMLQGAILQSRLVCEAHYQYSPEVIVELTTTTKNSKRDDNDAMDTDDDDDDDDDDDGFHVLTVHAWLYHTLVELLKNAMDATIKKYLQQPPQPQDGYDNDFSYDDSPSSSLSTLPPICIQVKRQDGFVVIEIHDQGIGLAENYQTPVSDSPSSSSSSSSISSSSSEWAFGFTNSSSSKRWDRLEEQQSYAMVRSPVSSLGVGLHVSRTMMRHFGGNVELLHRPATNDMDMGCTARVWLNTNIDYQEQLVSGEDDDYYYYENKQCTTLEERTNTIDHLVNNNENDNLSNEITEMYCNDPSELVSPPPKALPT